MPSWNTPHPTELRSATFAHKGRRKNPLHDSAINLCYAPRFISGTML
ncbi:hypothetical protein NKH63_27330 [Mesorhizobium sp. M0960]